MQEVLPSPLREVLLPSLCSCLCDELGLAAAPSAEIVARACELLGITQPGSLIARARACLAALGVS